MCEMALDSGFEERASIAAGLALKQQSETLQELEGLLGGE